MYCERCEHLGHTKDQIGWVVKICNHPSSKGKYCAELKECPINKVIF